MEDPASTKIVLPFPDLGPRVSFRSEGFGVPDGKRLHITEVSLFVTLGDTHHSPPDKAMAHLATGNHEDEQGRRMPVREPLGTLEWLDRSGPPWVGSTVGFHRSSPATFVDGGFYVVFGTKEELELGTAAGGTRLSHAIVLGRLVDRPQPPAA